MITNKKIKLLINIINIFFYHERNINDYQKNINLIKKIFDLVESNKNSIEDIQYLYKLPIYFLKTAAITEYSEFFVNETRCLWYNSFNPLSKNIIVYFHGGGYCLGTPEIYLKFMNRLDENINKQYTNILLFDYKKSPDFQYPFAINESFNLYKYLLRFFSNNNFIFIGDSAGANLLIQTCNKIIEENLKQPKALICLSPWIISNIKGKFWNLNKNKDYLNEYCINLAKESYIGNTNTDNYRSILDFNYNLFPPIYIRAGGNELILDEIYALAEKIKSNRQYNFKFEIINNMCHAFDLIYSFDIDNSPKLNNLIDYINSHLN